jgi:hypothetical protein
MVAAFNAGAGDFMRLTPMPVARAIMMLVIAVAFDVAGAEDISTPSRGVADLLRLQQLDQRVASVGYRLARSAGSLCPDQAPLVGIAVQDLGAYGSASRDDARRAFDLGPLPAILAIAHDSPAERVGLRVGDWLVAVDGEKIAPASGSADTYDRVAAVEDSLERHASDSMLDLEVLRSGAAHRFHLDLERGCASRFQVRPSARIDAAADGKYVEVTSAYVESAATDDGLAILLAHELAHNILHHRDRLDRAGIRRGLLQHVGRSARLTRETEIEADRWSAYLVDRAGLSLDAALRFREGMWGRPGRDLFLSATHPSGRQRLEILRSEISRIRSLEASGLLPEPEPEPEPLPPSPR